MTPTSTLASYTRELMPTSRPRAGTWLPTRSPSSATAQHAMAHPTIRNNSAATAQQL